MSFLFLLLFSFLPWITTARNCCLDILNAGIRTSRSNLSYFSLYQAEVSPACVAHPSSSSQVAVIVQMQCEFAVRSGGHMAWSGASSAHAPGITIDLAELKDIEYNEGTKLATFGAGLRWRDVYHHLSEYNRTVQGARNLDVGVGGFLIGGGISFPGDTFASGDVLDYEVVLASGQVVHANADEHSELFWALKYGSTNYGVVTRFTMKTSEAVDMWGGVQVFRIEHASEVLRNLVELTLGLGKDVREYMGIFMQGGIVWVPRLLLGDVRREFGLPSTANTMRVADRTVVYDEWAEAAMKSGHHEWYTLTVKPDVRFAMEVFEQGQKMFDGKGLWTLAFQPLPGHMFRDGEAVLNMLVMTRSREVHLKELVQWTETNFPELVKPFVYMNYASGEQDAYRGLDLRRYWDVKMRYDPSDYLGKYWVGGFKLPVYHGRDESEL